LAASTAWATASPASEPTVHLSYPGSSSHVATDDASRISYTEIVAEESGASVATFFRAAVARFARLDISVEHVLTDNGSGYPSKQFQDTCADLVIRHKVARPYTTHQWRGRAVHSDDAPRVGLSLRVFEFP
jgi:transposase InsO family protein